MISNLRCTASTPVRARIASTVSGKLLCENWRAERLIVMSIGRSSGRSWFQATLCWQARSITQRPIGWIRPLSSATGMNSEGSMMPRCG